MLQVYRIVRDAAERVAAAAKGTIPALRDARVEQEPAFTDRMLGRIEQAMDGYSHHGVSWKAKTLTDRGRKAQEARFGADFFGVLEIDLPNYSVHKGFLAQAKLIEPGAPISTAEFERMRQQCSQMLQVSSASFLFLYSQVGIFAVPAVAIVGSVRTNPHHFYSRSISRFFEEHFASFIGDQRIRVPDIRTLEAIAAEYETRTGIKLTAEAEGVRRLGAEADKGTGEH